MKRIMTALVATTAFAASPAIAHDHMKDGDEDKMAAHSEMKKDWDKSTNMKADKYIESTSEAGVTQDELDARSASQLFLAIDQENDGLITKSEWEAWQNRSETETKLFADYDADSDGDIEFSEYLETYDS